MQYTTDVILYNYTLDLEHIICKLYILIMHSLVTVTKIILFYMFKWDPRIYIAYYVYLLILHYIS